MKQIYLKVFALLLLCFSLGKAQAQTAAFTSNGNPNLTYVCANSFLLTCTNTSTPGAGTTGYSWNWLLSLNGVLIQTTTSTNSPTVAFNLTQDGCYTMQLIMMLDGVIVSTTSVVNVFCMHLQPTGSYTIGNSPDTFACNSLTLTLNAVPTGGTPPYSYLWVTGTNPGTSTLQNPTLTYPCQPNPYAPILQITDANGCVSSSIILPGSIQVPCGPSCGILVTPPLSSCQVPANVTFNSTCSANNYVNSWVVTGGAIPSSGNGSPSPNFLLPNYGCYGVILTTTDINTGCVGVDSIPNVVCLGTGSYNSVSISTNGICSGDCATITVSTNAPPGGSVEAVIQQNPGGTTYTANPTTSVCPTNTTSAPITYTYTVTAIKVYPDANNPSVFCMIPVNSNNTVTLTVNPLPNASIIMPAITHFCSLGHTFCMSANTTGNDPAAIYEWWASCTPSDIFNVAPMYSLPTNFCAVNNAYCCMDVGLKVSLPPALGGCSTTVVLHDTLCQTPMNFGIVLDSGVAIGCGPRCVKYRLSTNTQQVIDSIKWVFGDGDSLVGNASIWKVVHCYDSLGCNTVKLWVKSIDGCEKTVVQPAFVKVGLKIPPLFSYSDTVKCLKNGKAIIKVFPDSSLKKFNIPVQPGNTGYCPTPTCKWIFKPAGGGALVTSTNCDSPTITLTDTGVYHIIYIICSANCCDTMIDSNAVTIIGIKNRLIDSVHCSSGGSNAPSAVTIKNNFSVKPPCATPSSVKIFYWNNAAGTGLPADSIVNLITAPPIHQTITGLSQGSHYVMMVTTNPCGLCDPDTLTKVVNITKYAAIAQLVNQSESFTKCLPSGQGVTPVCWALKNASSIPANPEVIEWDQNADGTIDGTGATFNACWDSCGQYLVKLIVRNQSGSCIDSSIIGPFTVDYLIPKIKYIQYPNCSNMITVRDSSCACYSQTITSTINWHDGSSNQPSTVTYTRPCNVTQVSTHNFVNVNGQQATDIIIGSNIGCTASFTFNVGNLTWNQARFSFNLADTLVCLGSTINFLNTTLGNASFYCFDTFPGICSVPNVPLPNNCTHNAVHPITFNYGGYYQVKLHAGNGVSNCVSDTCVTIHVQNGIPDFDIPDTVTCVNSCVKLIDKSSGAIDEWDYYIYGYTVPLPPGPTGISYLINPHILFSGSCPDTICLPFVPGDYTVCQTIKRSSGTPPFVTVCKDSICKPIHVEGAAAIMNVANTDTLICLGDSSTINWTTNAVSGIIFPGSDPPIFLNPMPYVGSQKILLKTPGRQLVTMFFDDGQGCVASYTDTIAVDRPNADFTISPIIPTCGSDTFCITNTSQQVVRPINPTSSIWRIYLNGNTNPDTTIIGVPNFCKVFYKPGNYDIELIIASDIGCKDTIRKNGVIVINENPVASFQVSADTICIGNCVTVIDTVNYPAAVQSQTWFLDWPNALPTATTDTAQVCYNAPGMHYIRLITTLITGCVDTSEIDSVLVLPQLISGFNLSTDSICGATGNVNFTNTSSVLGGGITMEWNFGDDPNNPYGTQSNLIHPSHTFTLTSATGAQCFVVTLRLYNNYGCIDSIKHNVCIFANPLAALTIPALSGCDIFTAVVSDNSTSQNLITNYDLNWGGGIGANYNSNVPPMGISHVFTPTGTYNAVYKITTVDGCTNSINLVFTTHPNPIAYAGRDSSLCAGSIVQLGSPNNSNYTYSWYLPANPTLFNPSAFSSMVNIAPLQADDYCVAVTNQFGCVDSDCVHIDIIPLVIANACCDTSICIGTPVTLRASGALQYLWNGIQDAAFTSTDSIITFVPPYTSNYKLTVTGPCNTAQSTVLVGVNPLPLVNIESEITMVAGQPYPILSVSNPSNTIQWSPDYNISCTNCANPTITPDVSTTYVVTVTDPYGCISQDSIKVTVLCDRNNQVYIPNAITPGTHDKNSYFYVQGTGVKEVVTCRIFDRWGNLAWSKQHIPLNDKDSGWNGEFKGKEVTSDVYMYEMELECHNGTKFSINGNFTVIR